VTRSSKLYPLSAQVGPASDQEEGSPLWAECLAVELRYKVDRTASYGVDSLVPLVKSIMLAKVPPWEVFPDPPCKTVDAFFELSCGLSYEQLWQLINVYRPDSGEMLRRLDTTRAREQITSRPQGAHHPYDIRMTTNSKDGGTGSAYLLRRIARSRPDVLEAYERGEFKSVRAAADAADIPRDNQPLALMKRALKKATEAECREFLPLLWGKLSRSDRADFLARVDDGDLDEGHSKATSRDTPHLSQGL
jgi:hypothetical protein